jgi:hypothetical protein
LIGRSNVNWPYPFAEGKQFVLIITAGSEGYHVNVDGRHVTSFPYRTVSLLWNSVRIILSDISRFNFLIMLLNIWLDRATISRMQHGCL